MGGGWVVGGWVVVGGWWVGGWWMGGWWVGVVVCGYGDHVWMWWQSVNGVMFDAMWRWWPYGMGRWFRLER